MTKTIAVRGDEVIYRRSMENRFAGYFSFAGVTGLTWQKLSRNYFL